MMPPAAKTDAVAAAVEAAASAANSMNGKAKIDTWESPKKPGLVFKLSTVSRYAILAAQEKIIEPEIPVVWIEEKSRSEANPNHPAYREALRDYNVAVAIAVIDTYLAIGTSLLKKPDDLPGPETEEWIEKLEAARIEVPRDKKFMRYLMWVKLEAVVDDDELTNLIRACQRFNGLTIEDDVEDALETLKSDSGSDPDPPSTSA